MSYELTKGKIGKEPFVMVGMVMDKCSRVSGVAPCTSTATGDLKCFNTRATCRDAANYNKTTTELIFCEPRSNLPHGMTMFPALKGTPKKSPTSITGGKGLGDRAVISVQINDFIHHDRGIDPYYAERSYKGDDRGTFLGKFLKRNPYYEGRTLKAYYGYLNAPFSLTDFIVHEYDITDISGANGVVTVTAKDILVRTYKEKNTYPKTSTGKLLADIAISAATGTLTPAGIGNAEYPASGYVSIGDDIKQFTRSGDVLTFSAHATWGTIDEGHDAGETVQVCKSWGGANIIDVLYELLVTGAEMPAGYVPYATNWTAEKDKWLSTSVVTGILSKPEDISRIISELTEQFMFDIWWDATDKLIYIKALAPEVFGTAAPRITDNYHILKNSLKIKRDTKQRLSEIQVWYGKINHIADDNLENFAACVIKADASRAGADRYGSNAIKVIKSRWMNDGAQALQLAGRLLARYADTPEVITFDLAAKDDALFSLGDVVSVESWNFQDITGAGQALRFQVTQIEEIEQGHSLRVNAIISSYTSRYAIIAPDYVPAYTLATDEQKSRYGFICYDSLAFYDGEDPYNIL